MPVPATLRHILALAVVLPMAACDTPSPVDTGAVHVLPRLRAAADADTLLPEGAPRARRTALREVLMDSWEQRGGEEHGLRLRVPADARLFAAAASVGAHGEGGEIRLRTRWREEVVLRLAPETGRGWVFGSADLARFAGQDVRLTWRALGPADARLLWGSPVVTGAPGTRRNAVLWVVDTLRRDFVGAFGDPRVATPEIDRIARDGALWPEAFSTSSWTRPSMASVMTGLSAPAHGVIDEGRRLPEDLPVFAQSLRDAGWYTVALITNPNAAPSTGMDRGFDLVVSSGALMAHFVEASRPARVMVSSSTTSGTSEWVHAWLRDRLEGIPTAPLFLWVQANDPHAPYGARAPFALLSHPQRRTHAYATDVRAADWFLGQSLRRLAEHGTMRDAMVMVLSDHGEEFRDHGGTGHGRNLYHETTRVPLVLAAPGRTTPGSVRARRASLADVAPTLLDALGVGALETAEGESLLRDAPERTDSPPVFQHVVAMEQRLAAGPVAQRRLDPERGMVAVVDGTWKLVLDASLAGTPGRVLFDLTADPGETHDVSAEHPARADSLAAKALSWWAARRRGAAPAAILDTETRERLRALGYAG